MFCILITVLLFTYLVLDSVEPGGGLMITEQLTIDA